jgi:8-oxo-dGTP diphosphatase
MAEVVRAAGGVVWRRIGDGPEVEVVLVHRPAYDDWTIPKGKQEPGETDEETAFREVQEETGLTCRLGPELESVEYIDARGRPKLARYWAMTVEVATPREPDDEVDATRWLPAGEAEALVTYEKDRSVLRSLLRVLDRL